MTREEARQKYTYYYKGAERIGYWFTSESTLSEKEFDEMYPLVTTVPVKENFDRTKNWLADRKSY